MSAVRPPSRPSAVGPVRWRAPAAGLLLLLVACRAAPAQGPAQKSPAPAPLRTGVRVETVTTGLANPWALDFLPDGRILATERAGRLRIVSTEGRLSPPLSGMPAVNAQGQGGRLDVAVDPAFAGNGLVYLSFSESGPGAPAPRSRALASRTQASRTRG
jgi:glucose/arabinose dehydrogenase